MSGGMPDGVAAVMSPSDVAFANKRVAQDDPVISGWFKNSPAMHTEERPDAVVVPSEVVAAMMRSTVTAQKLARHVSALACVDVDDRAVAQATLHAWRCEWLICPKRNSWDEQFARLLRHSTTEQRMAMASVYPIHARLAELMEHATGIETVRAMAGEE